MSKRLFARGSDGVVAIVEGGNDAYINSPLPNIANVHFHSSFSYMPVPQVFELTVNFPYREAPTQTSSSKGKSSTYPVVGGGSQSYTVGYHGLGYVPAAIGIEGGVNGLSGNYPIQQSGLSLRSLALTMDTNYVYLLERWYLYANSLGATSRSYKVFVFRNPV